MADEQETNSGVPDWIVTYGDVMSLLLTFFIMLAATSQMTKEDEKYRAVVESLRDKFGYDLTLKDIPGEFRVRNSPWQLLANLGRAKRKDLANGGNESVGVTGDQLRVEAIRPGLSTIVGGAVYFDEDSAELPDSGKRVLDALVPLVVGKAQKIEIRGHASKKPIIEQAGVRDHWDLAYERCYVTMQYLITHGIEPKRFRLSSAGAFDPLNNALDPALRKYNARVEVLLWDEQVEDLPETESETASVQ
jgi:chemotaxis protein MotB